MTAAAADLESLLHSKKRRDASDLLHNIKGISGNLGAKALYEHTVQLEKEIVAGRKPDLSELD